MKMNVKRTMAGALAFCMVLGGFTGCSDEKVPEGLTYRTTDEGIEITGYEGTETELVIPSKIEKQPVVSIKDFENATITKITLPSTLTSIEGEYIEYAEGETVYTHDQPLFSMCSALTEIVVDEDNEKYSSVSGMLLSKDGTILLSSPPALSHVTIPDTVTTIGSYAFQNSTITDIDLPDNLNTIGFCAFSNSTISAVDLPDSLEVIDFEAFKACGITEITIPESVTEIGYGAFEETYIGTLTVPESVESLGPKSIAPKAKTVYLPEKFMEQPEVFDNFDSYDTWTNSHSGYGPTVICNNEVVFSPVGSLKIVASDFKPMYDEFLTTLGEEGYTATKEMLTLTDEEISEGSEATSYTYKYDSGNCTVIISVQYGHVVTITAMSPYNAAAMTDADDMRTVLYQVFAFASLTSLGCDSGQDVYDFITTFLDEGTASGDNIEYTTWGADYSLTCNDYLGTWLIITPENDEPYTIE